MTLLEELSVVKSRYKMLCTQLEEISIEQRESMSCIHATLENTMKMVQALQRHADLEVMFSVYNMGPSPVNAHM